MISEIEIQKFINEQRNKSRTTLKTALDKHYSTIDRLYNHEKISRSSIYRFLKSQDDNIGNMQNFYKYINRRFPKVKTEQLQATETQETEKTTQTITEVQKTATTAPTINKTPTQLLSQDYDLLSNAE